MSGLDDELMRVYKHPLFFPIFTQRSTNLGHLNIISIYLPIYTSIYIYIYKSIYLSIYISIYLSIYPRECTGVEQREKGCGSVTLYLLTHIYSILLSYSLLSSCSPVCLYVCVRLKNEVYICLYNYFCHILIYEKEKAHLKTENLLEFVIIDGKICGGRKCVKFYQLYFPCSTLIKNVMQGNSIAVVYTLRTY